VAEGWDPDTEIRLFWYYPEEWQGQQMAVVADWWSEIGLNVNYQLLPTDKVVETFYEKGEYDVLYGCCADYGNKEHYISLYDYYKCGLTFPEGYNATGVCSEELDAAMETINQTFDRQEEIEAYQTACTILGEQVVDMPLWMSPGLWTTNARIRNTIAPDGRFNEYVHTWWISEE
jgi:ABC-type transport system substrate-binding protein